MNELFYSGKVKGMKTLKQMIAERDVIPASELEGEKAQEAAIEKAFEEAAKTEMSHRKTKLVTGKLQGRVVWSRERFQED